MTDIDCSPSTTEPSLDLPNDDDTISHESHGGLRCRSHSRSPNSDASTSACGDGASSISTSPAPPARKSKLIVGILERSPSPSLLDICDPDSRISQSDFRGMVVLAHVFCGVYLVANPVYNMYENGYLIEPTLARDCFREFFLLMGAWATCFTWAFTSFLIFKAMVNKYIAGRTISVCQHASQALLVIGMLALVRWRRWSVFPSVFVCTVTFLHYMKMHSYVSCTKDLYENGYGYKGFPEVCTLKNFFVYLLCPVLVYNLSYPRAPHRFRPFYFIQKGAHLVGSLTLIYTVSSEMVIPVFEASSQYSPLHVWARLVVPLLVEEFLFFYMMFECILNMLAELTNWGDRQWYDDWWNCTTWDDFARKWNKPVHEFLLCHVYVSAYKVTKRNKFYASLSTFLFSAILHETFLATVLGLFRPYMFAMMMCCWLPLMALSQYHKHTTFGNYWFWFGLLSGVPFLTCMYGRAWASMIAWPSVNA